MMRDGSLRLFGPLIAANLIVWAAAFALFAGHPVLLGTALLAYGLGLRHAVDADHIAAIDNVTRKLIHARMSCQTTGLYFSLGHSAVVWLASIGIALAANSALPGIVRFREIGGAIGTTVSILFLLAIAAANVVVLKGVIDAIRRQKRGEVREGDGALTLTGPYSRLLARTFRLVSNAKHMFAIGFLFGLGFDTASEIAVLGISAAAAGNGLPIWSILVFPALFTAGMSLVDTADSALMTRAYGWAQQQPTRKLYYNLTVTFFSVVVALGVGGIEALALLRAHVVLGAGLRNVIDTITNSTASVGYAVIAGFALLWLGALLIQRMRRASPSG
jgi:high-affinity nickel-transport protein